VIIRIVRESERKGTRGGGRGGGRERGTGGRGEKRGGED